MWEGVTAGAGSEAFPFPASPGVCSPWAESKAGAADRSPLGPFLSLVPPPPSPAESEVRAYSECSLQRLLKASQLPDGKVPSHCGVPHSSLKTLQPSGPDRTTGQGLFKCRLRSQGEQGRSLVCCSVDVSPRASC